MPFEATENILTELDAGKKMRFEVLGKRAHDLQAHHPDAPFTPLSEIIEFLDENGFLYEVDWEDEFIRVRENLTRRVKFDLTIFEPEDQQEE